MPNPAHIHLMVVHIPVVGMGVAFLLHAYALRIGSQEVRKAALILFTLLIPAAAAAYLAGGRAEEFIERLDGFTHSNIESHEDMAVAALVAVCVTGILALLQLVWMRFSHATRKLLGRITFATSLAALALLAVTASRGGKIRHSELLPMGADPAQPPKASD